MNLHIPIDLPSMFVSFYCHTLYNIRQKENTHTGASICDNCYVFKDVSILVSNIHLCPALQIEISNSRPTQSLFFF